MFQSHIISRRVNFAAGLILGVVLSGATAAYAAGIIAQPMTAGVYIDGQAVEMKGYLIKDAHYFQLRDLDEKLVPGGKDFSVVWDGENNRIIIDTSKGYDPDEVLPSPGDIQAPAVSIFDMRLEIIRLTNIERAKAGVPELIILAPLMDCAQAKAQDFLDSNYFGHNSPVHGPAVDMILSYVPGIRTCGENLATWTVSPQDVVSGWMQSPEHQRIMLAPKFTHIGVGAIIADNGGMCWVQHLVGY